MMDRRTLADWNEPDKVWSEVTGGKRSARSNGYETHKRQRERAASRPREATYMPSVRQATADRQEANRQAWEAFWMHQARVARAQLRRAEDEFSRYAETRVPNYDYEGNGHKGE
jgi:hypothetical protein